MGRQVVHLIWQGHRIACGARITFGKKGPKPGYTTLPEECSCFRCANRAEGLQDPQRMEIRYNARLRLGRE